MAQNLSPALVLGWEHGLSEFDSLSGTNSMTLSTLVSLSHGLKVCKIGTSVGRAGS